MLRGDVADATDECRTEDWERLELREIDSVFSTPSSHTLDEPQFAGQVVREGAQLPFLTDEYEFEGRVVRENALEQRGEETIRTVTLEIESAQPDVADSLEAGMRERVNGKAIASPSNVTVEPADIVLTSDDGNVYLREHPVEKDVEITAEFQVRESINGVSFKSESIRPGDIVLIDLGTVTIRATVTSL